MIIGIMTVNGFDFHPNKRFLEAANHLGHKILLINPYEIICAVDMEKFGSPGSPDFSVDILDPVPDVILPRQGSPMGEYGFVILRHFMEMKIPLVNKIEGVTIAKNQFLTLQTLGAAGIPVPNSCFITRKSCFFKAVAHLGGFPVIAKQVDGMGGDGVAKIENRIQAEKYLDTHLNPLKGMLVQQFITPDGRQDLRFLVIGGRLAGTMALEPSPGDFRANIHQNGRATAMDPPKELKDLALAAAKACCLEIAGVDMMVEKGGGPLVVEVNYSPGFKGLEAATGKDISRRIIDYVISAIPTKIDRK
ncbi:MAG: RimK family alpha-L-glutamate ligase [Desulfobacteraceae bacterium]|nr:RimK family alpha-L-glutamate ligase [Desulfobacteraceae bacterium]